MNINKFKSAIGFTKVVVTIIGLTLAYNVKADLLSEEHEKPDLAYGAKVWAETCIRCHNLRDSSEFSDYEWKPIITHMRIRAGLTGEDSRAILAFIQASNDPQLTSNTSANNIVVIKDSGLTDKQIYQQTCSTCHGSDGKGAFPGVPDFTGPYGRLSKPDNVLFKHIKEGFQSPGNVLAMPPRGGNPNLSDNDLKSVLDYLMNQFGPNS